LIVIVEENDDKRFPVAPLTTIEDRACRTGVVAVGARLASDRARSENEDVIDAQLEVLKDAAALVLVSLVISAIASPKALRLRDKEILSRPF
jgi:hypothetical protein